MIKTLLLLVFSFLFCHWASAFGDGLAEEDLQLAYQKAEALTLAFKNQEAADIYGKIAEKLNEKGQLYSDFGLEVLNTYAFSLEAAEQNEKAVLQLLLICDIATEKQDYKNRAEAHTTLARLYEKMNVWDKCKENLKLAEQLIIDNQIHSLTPRFYNRKASYYRVGMGQIDSALVYAKKALEAGIEEEQSGEIAVSHLLLGMLLRDSSYALASYHFGQSGKEWEKKGDRNGWTAILANLIRLNIHYNKLDSILMYADSAKKILTNQIHLEHRHRNIYENYMRVYEALGVYDSAYFYSNLYYENLLAAEEKSKIEKITEINEKYDNEKQARIIGEQDRIIEDGAMRRYWLLWVLSLSLIFSLILVFVLFRLRRSKNRIITQARKIRDINTQLSTSLKEKEILFSEIHHRVKNNLAVISSLLELQLETAGEAERASLGESMNRVRSMGLVHEMIYRQENLTELSIQEYVEELCETIIGFMPNYRPIDLQIDCAELSCNLQTAIPIGIILNELITNSCKYAQTKEEQGQLQLKIKIKPQGELFAMHYSDNGPGIPKSFEPEQKGSIGMYLIQTMTRQLKGKVVQSNRNGAHFDFVLKPKI